MRPLAGFALCLVTLTGCGSDDKAASSSSKACPAAFQSALGEGQHTGYEAAGQTRSFWLSTPTQSGARPLLVAFNGTGESGKQIFDRAKLQSFVDAGFVVLAPDSAGNGTVWPVWDGLREPGHENDPNADLDYFDSLVACVRSQYSVDAKRIYVAGHSAGGIFTNYVLQRRSELLAGGIPASGVFDLTSPVPAPKLDGMAVVVTWGGDNDAWGGTAPGGVSVPEFNFVEQAALASQYYEKNVEQVYCRGKNLGHAWLDQANPWMTDYLVAHPKGESKTSTWTFVAPDASASYTCSPDAAPLPTGSSVTCGASATAGCHEYCQFIGDCAAANSTVEPVLGPQLDALGFSGTKHSQCSGCVTQCESEAAQGGSADASVLTCFSTAEKAATCGSGISGAMPFIDATNKCCEGQTASKVCSELCGQIKTNSVAMTFFTACKGF